MSDIEADYIRGISAKAGFDDPWLLKTERCCFLCGIRLDPEIHTEEHLIPSWFIRRYKLHEKEGRGKSALYRHPFSFSSDWQVGYPDLTVPACNNCNCGYLLSVERQIKRMLTRPVSQQSIDSGWHFTFWLAKIIWGLHWHFMSVLKEHGQIELVRTKWKETRLLRQCLNVLRRTTTFTASSTPVSAFLYNCQMPPELENQFDWQVSLALNAIWLRVDGLMAVISFDLGWQAYWQSEYFLGFAHRNLHPWQAEQIGAFFFNAAGCRPQLPHSFAVVGNDQTQVHVSDPRTYQPLVQDTAELTDLLAVFHRLPVENLQRPDGTFHNYLVAEDGSEQNIDIKEYPWRSPSDGTTGDIGLKNARRTDHTTTLGEVARMNASNPFPVSHWPQQSPIKIFKSEALFVEFPKGYLSIDYRDAPFAGQFVGAEGHRNFELTKPHAGEVSPMLALGNVRAELVKIHLHTPSEHDLEGINQDGEIHFIHKIESPTTGSEFIVLAVFFKIAAKAASDEFFQTWAKELRASKKAAAGKMVQVDPRKLVPRQDKWYRYEGSLTSEPFGEIVTWIVFPSPLAISSGDLSQLKKDAHQPERPTQAINRRFVLRNFR